MAISFESFFFSKRHNMCEVSTPTREGDAFGMNSSNDCMFGSSKLRIAFKGLLLGAS
jgi:hypothetical protein